MNQRFATALRQIGAGLNELFEALAAEAEDPTPTAQPPTSEPVRGPEAEPAERPRKGGQAAGERNRRALRDFARRQPGDFTKSEVAVALEVNTSTAFDHIKWAIERGIIEDTGKVRRGGRGHPPKLYRYKPPEPDTAPRPKAPEPKDDLPAPPARGTPVPGTGRQGRPSDGDVRDLIANLRKLNWKVVLSEGGHYKVYRPDGKLAVTMPQSPSDWRSLLNAKAQLRKEGAPV